MCWGWGIGGVFVDFPLLVGIRIHHSISLSKTFSLNRPFPLIHHTDNTS